MQSLLQERLFSPEPRDNAPTIHPPMADSSPLASKRFELQLAPDIARRERVYSRRISSNGWILRSTGTYFQPAVHKVNVL